MQFQTIMSDVLALLTAFFLTVTAAFTPEPTVIPQPVVPVVAPGLVVEVLDAPTVSLDTQEQRLYDAISSTRGDSLTLHPGLTEVARERAWDMVSKGYFSHFPEDGRDFQVLTDMKGIPYAEVAENLARNNLSGVPDAIAGWIASPTHNDVLYDPYWTHVGIAAVTDAFGVQYFVALFLR